MRNSFFHNVISFAAVAFLLISGCSKKEKVFSNFETSPVSVNKYSGNPVADISVLPELGGIGFTGEGWSTNSTYNLITDSKAVKGGKITLSLPDFPVTLRPFGINSNSFFNAYTDNLFYESLISSDPVTLDYVPMIATHWKISEDNLTFKFRINPDAKWADGYPVTSDDVIATWKLMNDEGIIEPYLNQLAGSFLEPVAESRYIFSVKSKINSWRQFYLFASLKILPAHYIRDLSGKDFIEKYQYSLIPGSGPYIVLDNDIKKGESITVRRRSDYWGENLKMNLGKNNFDEINLTFINNDLIQKEKFKSGEIDVLLVKKASSWKSDFDFDKVKRGLVIKKRVFNKTPRGVSGLCINTRIKPFDNVNVRKALIYAFDRMKMNEKLFDNEYSLLNSYFPGSIYENPSNPKVGFNLDSASMLLALAGWDTKNSDGWLVRNGKVLEIDLEFVRDMEFFLTIFQEDLKKIGVRLNLKELDDAALFKLGNDKKFSIQYAAWQESLTPNPEISYSSKTADEKSNANWAGIKDKNIDNLCLQYNNSYNVNERTEILRKIDSLLCNYYGYIFTWYGPYYRIVFHNKFGFPESILGKYSGLESLLTIWYQDPNKTKEYQEALKDNNIFLKRDEIDNKYWDNLR